MAVTNFRPPSNAEEALNDAINIVPEKIIRSKALSTVAIKRLSCLHRFELDVITTQLCEQKRLFTPEQAWPLKEHFGKLDMTLAKSLETEFKKFVALTIIESDGVFSPSGPVDMYWHLLVLNTRVYERFCEFVWEGTQTLKVESVESQLVLPDYSDVDIRNDMIVLLPRQVSNKLSQEQRTSIYTLQEWDFSYFTNDLIDIGRQFAPEQVWPLREHFGKADIHVARVLEVEFKKFLALKILHPDMLMVSPGPVAMYWHWLIIHTIEYRTICNLVNGFQHHPYGNLPNDMELESIDERQAYAKVVELYSNTFGIPNPQIWHPPFAELPDFEAEAKYARKLFEESMKRNTELQNPY